MAQTLGAARHLSPDLQAKRRAVIQAAARLKALKAQLNLTNRELAVEMKEGADPQAWLQRPLPTYDGRRVVHVLSAGREASSFFCSLLTDASLPCLAEPFHGAVEGTDILADKQQAARLACLYRVGRCDGPAVGGELLTMREAEKLRDQWSRPGPVAFKTTRILDGEAIRKVNEVVAAALLQGLKGAPPSGLDVRYLMLLRDPRGVYASFKKFPSWPTDDLKYVCGALRRQHAAVGEASPAVPMKVLVFERWAADLQPSLKSVAAFAGVDIPTSWQQQVEKIDPITNWARELSTEEIAEVESNKDCRAYMDAMQYPLYASHQDWNCRTAACAQQLYASVRAFP